jgi:hypothetical protein
VKAIVPKSATKRSLPLVSLYREFAEAGVLMA